MNDSKAMEWTGERFTPGSVDGQIEVEHWHRYAYARDLTVGKDVLDIACGEGYGADFLAAKCKSVVGVDISDAAVAFAKSKYNRSNLDFRLGNCAKIPLPDSSVDAVVSFETIEHHDQHQEMFEEIKRVLRPDGILIISSPDKLNYSDKPNFKNGFHVKELYREEFESLLNRYFSFHAMLGQRLMSGSVLAADVFTGPVSKEIGVAYTENLSGPVNQIPWLEESIYLVAVASNQPIHVPAWSVFESKWLDRDFVARMGALNDERETQKIKAERAEERASRADIELQQVQKIKIELEQNFAQFEAQVREERIISAGLLQNEKNHVERLIGELEGIKSSRSWRITKPLRQVMSLFR